MVSQKKVVTYESTAVGRVGIVAPENPYNSAFLLRNHQVSYTNPAKPSSRSTCSGSGESSRSIMYFGASIFGAPTQMRQHLPGACGGPPGCLRISRGQRHALTGEALRGHG